MGNPGTRAAVRELKRLVAQLENGDLDMADLSVMCPPQVTAQGHAKPLPVLIVHLVAWQSHYGNWRAEKEVTGNGQKEAS